MFIITAACTLAACTLTTGCNSTPRRDMVLVKSTCFGFRVSPYTATTGPQIEVGLIRDNLQIIPVVVTSNSVAVPNFASSVSADLRLTSQQANEDYATGDAASQITKGQTAAQIGAAVPPGAPLTLVLPAGTGTISIATNVPPVTTNAVPATNAKAP